jgi:hypothetical protein
MRRFLLPVFFAVIAVSLPVAEGFGEDAPPNPVSPRSAAPAITQGPSGSTNVEQSGKRETIEHRATDLRRQVSDLQTLVAQVREQIEQRATRKPPTTDSGEQQAVNLQRQDGELHSELQGLIAELEQELELEMQSPLSSDTAERQERQTARDALKRVLADLKQQDGKLEELIGGHAPTSAQRDSQGSAAVANPGEQPTGPDLLERQTADMRSQIADLQRQNGTLQRQLAEHQQELAQRTGELLQRAHDLEAARAEAQKLRDVVETLRHQPQGEQASPARQKTEGQQTAVAGSAGAVATKPAPRPTRLPPVRQPAQSTPTPQPASPVLTQQPMQPTPTLPSATQQLQSARQWLSVGRTDEARRVLAMVQTQMVFVPVTPDQPAALGLNPSATDVGDAIRWLDIGAIGQAMRSITRAIESGTRAGG